MPYIDQEEFTQRKHRYVRLNSCNNKFFFETQSYQTRSSYSLGSPFKIYKNHGWAQVTHFPSSARANQCLKMLSISLKFLFAAAEHGSSTQSRSPPMPPLPSPRACEENMRLSVLRDGNHSQKISPIAVSRYNMRLNIQCIAQHTM